MSDHNKTYNGHFPPGKQRADDTPSATDSSIESSEDEFNLKQLLVAIWRRKWLVLSCVVFFGLFAGIIAFFSMPIYQSNGSILIYQPQNSLSSLGLGGGGALSDMFSSSYGIGLGTTVDNELQVLRSRKLSINIADSLMKERIMPDGRQYPIIFRSYPDDSTMTSQDTVVMRLQDRLVFKKVGTGADVIDVIYESPSAIAAGSIVNIVLNQFNQLSNGEKSTFANSTASFLKKEKASIQDSLARAEENLRVFKKLHPDNIINLAKLKRNVKINEELFETISKQYAVTSIQERSQFGLGRIIDNGYTPQKPNKPNTPLYILFGLIIGGVLSAGYVFIDVVFFNTIKGAEKMKKWPIPLLAVIPSIDEHRKEHYKGTPTVEVQQKDISTNLVTFLAPDSPIAESFRDVENNLIYAHEDNRPKSIVMTSSAQGEGKTTTIANLGVVLAEAGHKVIIVDADFRRPKLHIMFGLPNTPGITDVLSEDSRLKDIIQSTAVTGLSVLATGKRPSSAAATTRSKDFLELIDNLKNQFDFVLTDTAPFGVVTDSSLILKQADGVAVVAKFGETTEIKLVRTLEKLHRLNVNVLGTILTAYNYTKSNDVYPASEYYDDQYQPYSDYKEKV